MAERVELQPDYHEQIQADPHKRELYSKLFGEDAIARYQDRYGNLSIEEIRAVLQSNLSLFAEAKILTFLGPLIEGGLFKRNKSSGS